MKKHTSLIFISCYFAYLFIYVARLNLSMAAPSLKELSVLNTAQIGFLGSVFSVVYACGRLLSGILGDRTAPWKLISIGLIVCGICNLLIGLLPPFAAFLLLWGTNAFAQSLLWGPILRILSAIYPEDVAKQHASYMSTAVAVGNLVAIVLNTRLVENYGAQYAFFVPGGITLFVSTLIVGVTQKVNTLDTETTRGGFSAVLQNKKLQEMFLPAIIHGVMKDNISLWMTVYVMDTFGIDLEQSSYFILLIPVLGLIGRLLSPSLYRASKNREKPLMALSFFVCVLCSVCLIIFPYSAVIAVLYLSLIYMSVSVINVCLLSFFPIQFSAEGHIASASGVMDFATYLGTGLSSLAFGILIENHGYNSMYLVWLVLSILAIFLLIHIHKANHLHVA